MSNRAIDLLLTIPLVLIEKIVLRAHSHKAELLAGCVADYIELTRLANVARS